MTSLSVTDPYIALTKGGDPKTVVPDEYIVVRGGQKPMPPAGTTFSGATGATLEEAGSGVPHSTIRQTTAGEIRSKGGIVELKPEPARSGMINTKHVDITEGSVPSVFSDPLPNPVPKNQRIQ